MAFWEERLGGIADAVAPVAPPPHAWSQIEAAIAADARPQAAASLWQSIAFWRSFAIGAATLAAASIAALAYIGLVPASRPTLMATLAGSSGQPNFVAAVTATGNNLVVVPAALEGHHAGEEVGRSTDEPARRSPATSPTQYLAPAARRFWRAQWDSDRRLRSKKTWALFPQPGGFEWKERFLDQAFAFRANEPWTEQG